MLWRQGGGLTSHSSHPHRSAPGIVCACGGGYLTGKRVPRRRQPGTELVLVSLWPWLAVNEWRFVTACRRLTPVPRCVATRHSRRPRQLLLLLVVMATRRRHRPHHRRAATLGVVRQLVATGSSLRSGGKVCAFAEPKPVTSTSSCQSRTHTHTRTQRHAR